MNVYNKNVEWFDVSHFEGFYKIAKNGDVLSLPKSKGCFFTTYKIIARTKHKEGYMSVHLCRPEYRKRYLLHRLVAKIFIPNPNNYPEVNHIDGNKENNCVENLEWVTGLQNKEHAKQNNLTCKGIKNIKAKLTEKDVLEIRKLLSKGKYQKDIAAAFNVQQSAISAIKVGKHWGHIK